MRKVRKPRRRAARLERIEPEASWGDLDLGEGNKALLREVLDLRRGRRVPRVNRVGRLRRNPSRS